MVSIFPFPSLPAELRLEIYSHMIDNLEIHYPATLKPAPAPPVSEAIDSPHHSNAPTNLPDHSTKTTSQPHTHPLRHALLLANKAISAEFLAFVFTRATFVFPVMHQCLWSFADWPGGVSPSTLAHMTRLRFLRDLNRESCEAAYRERRVNIGKMIAQTPALRRLEVAVVLTPGMVEAETGGVGKTREGAGKAERGVQRVEARPVELVTTLDLEEYAARGPGAGWELYSI